VIRGKRSELFEDKCKGRRRAYEEELFSGVLEEEGTGADEEVDVEEAD